MIQNESSDKRRVKKLSSYTNLCNHQVTAAMYFITPCYYPSRGGISLLMLGPLSSSALAPVTALGTPTAGSASGCPTPRRAAASCHDHAAPPPHAERCDRP